LQELKPGFAVLVNPFNDSAVDDGCPVRQLFVTNLSAVEMDLTEMQDLALINFSQCYSTVEFSRWVPDPELERPVYD